MRFLLLERLEKEMLERRFDFYLIAPVLHLQLFIFSLDHGITKRLRCLIKECKSSKSFELAVIN